MPSSLKLVNKPKILSYIADLSSVTDFALAPYVLPTKPMEYLHWKLTCRIMDHKIWASRRVV